MHGITDMADEDFEEEEVWAVLTAEANPKARRANCKDSSSRRVSTGARMIPRFNASSETSSRQHRQSAPLSIPDWSKINRKHGKGQTFGADDEDEDDDRAPPHEWLAKKMARSQISSSSVCEGAGRTLKGRDLSKVRNAVLVKTGFLE
ncbi:hypothetical protein Cni_G08431 [Canna indica]|uniref:Senescence regulator n=1 Tax=Canna indica TaxID=4628 RepID=A0AAQ3K2E1_9LILI|nr:hypothetical protein Cni_G08431 [Canna indica]